MKVCAISANLGSYDPPHSWVEQSLPPGVELEIHRLTDENFPPRHKAMTSRLQCGIPKWFGADLFIRADAYLWVDASCALLNPQSVAWFLDHLGDADIALFNHPDRSTVREEYEFCKRKMAEGNRYLNDRYAGEDWDDQYLAIVADGQADASLFASTAFIYRPTDLVRNTLRHVFLHKARFLLHDQLALGYCVAKSCLSGLRVNVIKEHYMKTPYLTYVRNKKAVSA